MSGASDTDDEVQGELADFADPERFVDPSTVELDDSGTYESSDPKHPDFHDTMSGLWDNRDKFA